MLYEDQQKAVKNREMSKNERNMLTNKQVYIEELKSALRQSEDFRKKLQEDNSWIKAVSSVESDYIKVEVRSITPETQNRIREVIDKKFEWTDIENAAESTREERQRFMDETLGKDHPADPLKASKKLLEKYVKDMMPESVLKDKALLRILSTYKNVNTYSGTAADNKKMDKLYSLLDKYQADLSAKMLDDDSPELIERTEAAANIMMYLDNMKEAAAQKPMADENKLSPEAAKAIAEVKEEQEIAKGNQPRNIRNEEPPFEQIKEKKNSENSVQQIVL